MSTVAAPMLPAREVVELRALRHELADMTSDRDHWRRYAGSLEARLEALGYVVPADDETTLDYRTDDYRTDERAAIEGDTRC